MPERYEVGEEIWGTLFQRKETFYYKLYYCKILNKSKKDIVQYKNLKILSKNM